MSEQILGIHATTPGFETFAVLPHLGRQLTRVSGSTLTPYGTIEASFDTNTGKCSVTVPEGTTADVGIPKVEKKITSVWVNGQKQVISSEDEEFVLLKALSAGSYEIQVAYEGETPAFEEPEYEYSAEFVGTDEQTQGNWGGVYGSEGYVLCSYNGASNDLRVLPDYVGGIRYSKAMTTQWSAATDDVRAPAPNPLNGDDRRVGALYSNDPVACWQTFTVDIELNQERPYTVALYFVDWDNGGRELAVEMFDLDTLDMVAPVQVVDDYAGGKYLVYQFDKSVRFRIDQMRGPNATLSGIFFGEGMGDTPVILTETVDDQNPSVSYEGSWTHDPMPGAYANTFSYSNVAGNNASFTFEGSGISFLSSLESNRGLAEIVLDGVSQGKFDLYSAAAVRQSEVFRADNLSPGQHTIQVVVTGEKNPAAVGAYVDVDAFVVRNRVETPGSVAKVLTVTQPQQGETQLTMPVVPNGFEILLTASSDESVISLSGAITPQETEREVALTFTVSKDGLSAQAVRTVTVPARPVAAETDKTILEKVIAYAEQAKAGSEYQGAIESVRNSFDAAFTTAQAVCGSAVATQPEIDSAWISLMEQIHRLGFQAGDKTQLTSLTAYAEGLDLTQYVSAGQEVLAAALQTAQECLGDGDALQGDVEQAMENLLNVLLGLRLKADKSLLAQALSQASLIDPDAYTPASVETFNRARAEAENVMNNPALTAEEDQAAVDAAAESLLAAMQGLVRVDGAVRGTQQTAQAQRSPATGETLPAAAALLLLAAGACLMFRKEK